jgi:hypothetical protein
MSAQFNAPDKFFTATFNAGTTVKAPESDYDPYTDSALLNPWPGYRELRDAGPARSVAQVRDVRAHPARLGS